MSVIVTRVCVSFCDVTRCFSHVLSPQSVPWALWLTYTETELKSCNVQHAHNLFDRPKTSAINILNAPSNAPPTCPQTRPQRPLKCALKHTPHVPQMRHQTCLQARPKCIPSASPTRPQAHPKHLPNAFRTHPHKIEDKCSVFYVSFVSN
jgi:hypothetical protein